MPCCLACTLQATPAQRALSAELRITDGAQNCPFFMCITRPVRAMFLYMFCHASSYVLKHIAGNAEQI